MINNSSAVLKLEQEPITSLQESDQLVKSIKDVAMEILEQYQIIKGTLSEPANDNNPEKPTDPSDVNKTKEFLDKWIDLDSKVSECNKLIKEKGLTKEEQEKRYQAAFTVAEDYLRYELEIGNIFNKLPSLQGTQNIGENDYSKCRYITNVLGLPYKQAWRLSRLTPESVEKAIQYATEYGELPTRRLALLVLKRDDLKELHSELETQKELKKEERKAKKEAAEELKIQKEAAEFEAIQNPLPKVAPGFLYDVIYVDPEASSMPKETLKSYLIPASENSVMFLWTPADKLKERIDLMESWGFSYKENAIWDRMDSSHTGQYFSNQHDLLLVGTKGTGKTPSSREKSICRVPLKEGETKPEYYVETLKTMYPGQPCLDVIAQFKEEEV